jgi:hypothetical protein
MSNGGGAEPPAALAEQKRRIAMLRGCRRARASLCCLSLGARAGQPPDASRLRGVHRLVHVATLSVSSPHKRSH